MMGTSAESDERKFDVGEVSNEVITWIRQHAPLTELCQFGGWPDESRLQIEICGRTPVEWIVNISFVETIMEISECDVTERERCGQYAVSFDEAVNPTGIRLIQPL